MARAHVHYNRRIPMPLNLEPGTTLEQYRISRSSDGAAWARCTRPTTRSSAGRWRSRSCRATLADDPERLRRFTQEAKAASALNHPSILTIYDVDEVDGHPFLVTEFIDGQTLRERLRQAG